MAEVKLTKIQRKEQLENMMLEVDKETTEDLIEDNIKFLDQPIGRLTQQVSP